MGKRGRDMNIDNIMLDEIKKAAGGDSQAYDMLVRNYSPFIKSVARCYLRNKNDLDDVLQEVWIKVWENFEYLREPEKFLSWVSTIVRYHCIKKSKSEKLKKSKTVSMTYEMSEELLQNFLDEDMGLAEQIEKKELRILVDEILSSLPELYGVPLRLFYIEELKVREIEAILDISNSTVKWRLHQGRALFKGHMGNKLTGYYYKCGGYNYGEE